MKSTITLYFNDDLSLKLRNRMLDQGYFDDGPGKPPDYSQFDEEFSNYVYTLIEADLQSNPRHKPE